MREHYFVLRLAYLFQDETARNLIWIDGSPSSFQKWQKPRPSFVDFTKDLISYDSYILESESLLQPTVPGAYNASLCTGFVIYSSLNLEWVTLPCDQEFSDVLVICEGPKKAQNRDLLPQGRVLPRQYVECGHNWTMIGNMCYQMFNIPRDKEMSCHDFQARCQAEMSTLAGVPESWNESRVKEQRSINYFFSWLCTENDFLHGRVAARDGYKCSVWQIRMSLTLRALNVTSRQQQSSGSFTCTRKPVLVNFYCQLNQFQCVDGTCILSHYECDGSADCPDATDEFDCTHVCNAPQTFFRNSSMALFCYESCFPGECICHDLYYQCESGGCVPASRLCDGTANCKQGEDEILCPGQSRPLFPKVPEAQFNCSSGFVIPAILVNDMVPDCSGRVVDDEVLLQAFWLNYKRLPEFVEEEECPEEFTTCVKGIPLQCYPRSKICVFEVDRIRHLTKYCRNGAHLNNCSTHVCPNMYKCPLSYCVPLSYVCNGYVDCPSGSDEVSCETLSCPGMLKCRHDNICVHPHVLGDLEVDCSQSRDDEALLGMLKCPEGCQCLGLAIVCSSVSEHSTSLTSNGYRKIILMGNTFFDNLQLNFPNALHISLVGNGIKDLSRLEFGYLENLLYLNLAKNVIQRIGTKQFAGLANLRILELQTNPVYIIAPFAFVGLSNLEVLNISHLRLRSVGQHVFHGLDSLLVLDLSNNSIRFLGENVFEGIKSTLQSLHATSNPFEQVSVLSFGSLPSLRHIVVVSQKYCFYLSPTVFCKYVDIYNRPCCKIVNSKGLELISLTSFVTMVALNFVSIWFLCGTRSGTLRILNIASAVTHNLLALYAAYAPLVGIYYGNTFALYRQSFVKSYHCLAMGLGFYTFRHVAMVLLALGSIHRYEIVSKPFKNYDKSIQWYATAFTVVCVLLILSHVIPLYLFGGNFVDVVPACLAYPIAHKQHNWIYFLVMYIGIDIIIHGLVGVFSLNVAVAIEHSSAYISVMPLTKVKNDAIKRSTLYGYSQIGSLLASSVVQTLAIALEFGDQEMVAAALFFITQPLLGPLFYTFSTKSFRDWILRRRNYRV